MDARGRPLAAGTPPILTKAFHLPCDRVLHVTGPTLAGRGAAPSGCGLPPKTPVTQVDEIQLASAYRTCLDAARDNGIRSVAFPCISTGLFAFPNDAAAVLAGDAQSSTAMVVLDMFIGLPRHRHQQAAQRVSLDRSSTT